MSSNNQWITCHDLPKDSTDIKAIMWNDKLTIASQTYYDNTTIVNKNIYQYNNHNDQWNCIMTIPIKDKHVYYLSKALKWASKNLAPNTSTIPVPPYYDSCELSDLAIPIFDMNQPEQLQYEYNPNSVMYINDSEIHLITDEHIIWNTKDNTLKITKKWEDYHGISAIYVASKSMILLVGGQEVSLDSFENAIGIWCYYLKTQKWKQLFDETTFEFNTVSLTLSANENYVIMACAYKQGECSNKIFVLDIHNNNNENDYKLRECDIVCPKYGPSNLVRLGNKLIDKLLVCGWIKQVFKKSEFKDLTIPPICIFNSIVNFYDEERLHWIHKCWKAFGNDHYMIPLQHILCSLL
eukprot:19181_1